MPNWQKFVPANSSVMQRSLALQNFSLVKFFWLYYVRYNIMQLLLNLQEIQRTKEEQNQVLWCGLHHHQAPTEWAWSS